MKTNKFLLGALAALSMGVMASCSSEEPAVNGGTTDQVGDRYMAVRISVPSSSGTRAEGDNWSSGTVGDAYEVGTDAENKIEAKDLRFYFFTDQYEPYMLSATNINGEVTPSNVVTPISLSGYIQDGGEQSTIDGVLVLGKAANEGYAGKAPSYVLCAANLSDSEFASLANENLDKVSKEIATMGMVNGEIPKFKMTSATYLIDKTSPVDGKSQSVVICSTISEDNIKSTPADAQKAPVDIYLDRQICKVRTTGLTEYTPQIRQNDGTLTNDGKIKIVNDDQSTQEVELKVELTGWQLCSTMTQARMFKEIAKGIEYFKGWNSPNLHRSHWALTLATAVGSENNENAIYPLKNESYDIYDESQFKLKNYDSNNKTENIAYTYPNTYFSGILGSNDYDENVPHPSSVSDRTTGATAVVVRGVVKIKNETSSNFEAVDFVKWFGSYYLLDTFKAMVVRQYNIEYVDKISDGEMSALTVDDVKIDGKVTDADNKTSANKWCVRVNDDLDGNGVKTWRNYSRYNNVEFWKKGVTSYYINIKHADKTVDSNGNTYADGKSIPLYGLVRNHIYEHDITGVVGLGVPGNDRENPEPDKETFLACLLNVLNWGLVKNSIVLE